MSTHDRTAADAADEIDLLPTPKELELADATHPVEGWEIVVPEDAPLLDVAASEINDRVAALGGESLAVRNRFPPSGPALVVGRWNDPGIRELGQALDVRVTPADPGEQGYAIAFGEYRDRPVVLLGGSDRQGALYAAVTFRRLLAAEGGEIVAREASVRDWPDFKLRRTGNIRLDVLAETGATLGDLSPLEEAVAEQKRTIDWFLRHKINQVSVKSHVHSATLVPEEDVEPRLARKQEAAAREVLKYAHERGVQTRFSGGVEIGDYLSPEERAEAVERHEGTSYRWDAIDAHRRHAEDAAEQLPDGAGVYSLHPYDGGGYGNPENWNDRSPATEEMYGDDRAWADLEQFATYFTAVREAEPGIDLEAVVYPYHFQFAREDFPERYRELATRTAGSPESWFSAELDEDEAREMHERLLAYNEEVAEGLPSDAYIVFREAGQTEYEAVTDIYDGHDFTIWIYPARNRGWQGSFVPQVRFAQTFWRPEHRDVYYFPFPITSDAPHKARRARDVRVVRLAQQEYLWGVDRPDAEPAFENEKRWYEIGGREITDYQREHLIPRIARILYGELADVHEALIAENVSLHYVSEPEFVAGTTIETEGFDDPFAYMDEQAETFVSLRESFESAVDALDPSEANRSPESARAAAWTVFYYRYTTIAAIKAKLEAGSAHVAELLADGNPERAAMLAEELLDGLESEGEAAENARERSDELADRLRSSHLDAPPYGNGWIEELAEFEPGDFEAQLREQLEAARSALEDG